MLNKKIGVVSEKEKKEIEKIFMKLQALKELSLSLHRPNLTHCFVKQMHQKIALDIKECELQYDMWWKDKNCKYDWEKGKNTKLSINFATNEVFLIQDH